MVGNAVSSHTLKGPVGVGRRALREPAKGSHQPLITHDIFNRVQKVLGGTTRPRKARRYTFTGLLTCAKCGCSLTAEMKKGHSRQEKETVGLRLHRSRAFSRPIRRRRSFRTRTKAGQISPVLSARASRSPAPSVIHINALIRRNDSYNSTRLNGTTLGHYTVLKPLGAGGMGEVYLAEDARLKRRVAIKILPAALSVDPDRRERFEREAQTVAALNHPNIVTVHSVEHVGDKSFLTLEYVDGRTIGELIGKSGLPLRRFLTLATQIADAVAAAHQHHIVHRDLKPANVMVTAEDRVKVLDFGLAKLREAQEHAVAASMPTRELTGEGKIVGTVAYMSPEQAEGRPIDERSDIFSLGVMLYEMATGERPFKGDTSVSTLSSILRDTPRPLTEINPALPRDLTVIVRRCLAKDPDRRYQSAKDLRNELEELQQSLDSGELSAPHARAFDGGKRRNPIGLAVTAAAILATLATTALLWNRAPRSEHAASPVVTHARLTQTPGIEQFPVISPDGKWVAYSKGGDIFLQSVTGQRAINLTNDAVSNNQMPAFSPDGEQIAFRSGRSGGGLFVMGRTGESVRRVTDRGWYPSWFGDGRRIVFSTDGTPGPESIANVRSALMTVNIAGGTPTTLVSGYYAVQPRVSPHGKRIAFWAMRNDQEADRYNRDIWTIDINGGSLVRATDHPANDWNPVWSPDGRWLFFLSNRSGSMNLWRVAIDETTGRTSSDPEPITAPSSYVSNFTLSADGRIGAYLAQSGAGNIGRASFDPARGVVSGAAEAITVGAHDFFSGGYVDVTRDGRTVVATTSARGQEDLYLVSTADGAIRQLTNDFFRDRAPRWTDDGRRVLFYSDRSGQYALWSIDADGGSLRQLTPNTVWRGYPVPSPDGSRVVSDDIDTHRLFVYDVRDFSKPIDELPPNPDASITNLLVTSWSPDGSRILYNTPGTTRVSVWMFSFATRTHERVTFGAGAAWLKDSRRFVFSDGGRLRVFDLATHTAKDVLEIPGENLAGPRLAVDDTQLVFLRSTSDGDIWLMRFEK